MIASRVVYSFSCVCSAFTVGRMARKLSIRMKENHPSWLHQGGSGKIAGVILAHLVDDSQCTDTNQAFRVIDQLSLNLSKQIRLRTLGNAETLGTRHLTPISLHKSVLFLLYTYHGSHQCIHTRISARLCDADRRNANQDALVTQSQYPIHR